MMNSPVNKSVNLGKKMNSTINSKFEEQQYHTHSLLIDDKNPLNKNYVAGYGRTISYSGIYTNQ